MDLIPLQVTAE